MTTFTIPADQLPDFMKPRIKEKPAFCIFKKDEAGNSQLVGSIYPHKKGSGCNIIINGERFVAFPPNPNTKPSEV
jgi:hypothetical protein